MARIDTLPNFLTDVADAIRTKTGSENLIPPEEYDTEIESIQGGMNWSAIGYSETPETLVDAYNTAKDINDNFDFDSTRGQAFMNRTDIIYFPKRTFTNLSLGNQYFRSCSSMLELVVDMPKVTNFSQMCYQCGNLQKVIITNSKLVNAGNAFYQCFKLKSVDLSTCSFYDCTELSSMFQSCNKITDIHADFTVNPSRNTTSNSMFYSCSSLVTAPEISANITQASQMFYNCTQLKNVPYYNMENCSLMTNMFSNCSHLTDESLNNILLICANCKKITASKTLKTVGLSSTQASRCENLSNWQTFLDAGWLSGYATNYESNIDPYVWFSTASYPSARPKYYVDEDKGFYLNFERRTSGEQIGVGWITAVITDSKYKISNLNIKADYTSADGQTESTLFNVSYSSAVTNVELNGSGNYIPYQEGDTLKLTVTVTYVHA